MVAMYVGFILCVWGALALVSSRCSRGVSPPWFVAFVLLAGCAGEPGPPLVRVVDVTPRDAEVGERLEVLGEGFPLGKTARVTFRGALHRPGEPPARRAEIVAEAQVTSPERVDVAVTEGLESLFCGSGDTAAHTTFHGEVEVAFAALAPGAPPVTGVLSDVTLDFRPKGLRRAVVEAQAREGARTLAFLGMQIATAMPASGGLLVEAVNVGSAAAAAGIQPGDVLLRFDEVRVLSPADVVPAGDELRARVVVRRADGVRQDLLEVSLAGYEPRAPRGLLGSAILLTLTALAILLFLAPTAGVASPLERRVVELLRRREGEGPAATLARLLRGPAEVPAAAAMATAPFLVAPVAVSLFAAEVDVGVLYLLATTALLLVVAARAALGPRAGVTRREGLRLFGERLLLEAPRALAVTAVVLESGSLRISDAVRAQGAWPWQWLAFRHPMAVALSVSFVLASLPAAGPRPEPRPFAPLALADLAHGFLMMGLATALYLGGWRLPWLGPGEQEAKLAYELLGALLFAAKGAALSAVLLLARRACAALSRREAPLLSWKLRLPLSIVALAATAVWLAVTPAKAVQGAVAAGTFLTASLALVVEAVRLRRGAVAPEARLQLNPFL